jgi:hypothetical protein
MVPDFTEVGFAQTKESCSVKFRVPANVVVGVWVKLFSVFVPPDFLSVILSFRVYRTRIPVVLLAWDVWPSLKQEDAFAARRELPSEGPPTRARADDNEIVVFAVLHCDDSSAKATFPYSPTGKKMRVNLPQQASGMKFLSAWKAKSRTFLDRDPLKRQPTSVPRL